MKGDEKRDRWMGKKGSRLVDKVYQSISGDDKPRGGWKSSGSGVATNVPSEQGTRGHCLTHPAVLGEFTKGTLHPGKKLRDGSSDGHLHPVVDSDGRGIVHDRGDRGTPPPHSQWPATVSMVTPAAGCRDWEVVMVCSPHQSGGAEAPDC